MAAELAIVGARIRTLDPARPFATALAARGGIVVAVGGDAEVREHCDARTELLHAGGRTLVPGLVDAHLHPFWGAELARGIDLSACRTLAQVRAALSRAARTRRGGWVFGHGLDYDAVAPCELRGELIDGAVGDAPAFVRLADMHTALVTRRALELAGVDGPRAFADASQVVCRDGRPTGELREHGAQRLVLAATPPIDGAELRAQRLGVLRRLNAQGLTGAHVMDGGPETHDLLRGLEGAGDLTLRLRVPLLQMPETTEDEMRAQLPLRDAGGRLWRGGVAKFFADGVIDSGTAWLERAGLARRGNRAVLAAAAAARPRDRVVRARGVPMRHPHDRRPRGAIHARRVHARRRRAWRPPSPRAPRDPAGRSRRGDPGRRGGGLDATGPPALRARRRQRQLGRLGWVPHAPRAPSAPATCSTRARSSRSAAIGRSPTATHGSAWRRRDCGGCPMPPRRMRSRPARR